VSTVRIIAIVCTAQVFAQIGAFAVPALLPTFIDRWDLSGTEAGWIIGAFYLSYTATVPVLVSLTDRIDPKRIYLGAVLLTAVAALGYATLADGFWSAFVFRLIAGVGWAGTYMPGLKALSDFVEGPQQSRGVAFHAGSVGVSGAASFIVASTIASWFGWRWGIAFGGVCALLAFLIMAFLLPSREPKPAGDAGQAGLLDFRPVLRNRSALAYSLGYCFHTWEMNALRAWVVTFLTFALATSGGGTTLLAPAAIATVLSLAGVWASVSGNEVARRIGRRRFIICVMLSSMAVACVIGFTSGISYELAASLCVVYGILIWADSSSLTAGTVGSALPRQRGATMAVHSTLGYAGGFVGPLAMGAILDLAGGESAFAWGIAFAHVGAIMALGLLAMVVLRPKDLAGDRDN
jgi:MFS family permease